MTTLVPNEVIEAIGSDLSNAIIKAERSGKPTKIKVTIEVRKDGSIDLL